MQKFSKLMAATLIVSGSISYAYADSEIHGGSGLNHRDTAIIRAVAQANIDEVAAGHIALERSKNPDVKMFAQTMIDDHSKALSETKMLAQNKRIALPTEPDAEHKKMSNDLATLSDGAFDKKYVEMAGTADHKKVHAALVKDMKSAQDPDLKSLLGEVEPTVAHHLQMSEDLQSKLK